MELKNNNNPGKSYEYIFLFTEEERLTARFSDSENHLIKLCKKNGNISSKLMILHMFAENLEKIKEHEKIHENTIVNSTEKINEGLLFL